MHPVLAQRRSARTPAQHAALLLLLAWLPTLSYLGHWDALRGAPSSHGAAHVEGPAGDDAHAQHCHLDVEGCAEGSAPAPALSASAQLDVLRPPPEVHLAPAHAVGPAPANRSDAPATPPPRST